MNIKLIALDMDRTTLNSDGQLEEETRQALEKVADYGVHIVIASGRAFSTLPKEVLSCRGIEYAVTLNGAAVYRISDGACLFENTMGASSIEKILALTKQEPITYEAFFKGDAYTSRDYFESPQNYGASGYGIEYIKLTRRPVDDMNQFMMEHKNSLNSIDLVVGDPRKKEQLYQRILQRIPEVYVTSSVTHLIEISNTSGGKETGIRALLDILKIRPDEVAAFGDADNDCEMLQFAGIGVAVENASPSCKQAANLITESNDDCGVAHSLKKMIPEAFL